MKVYLDSSKKWFKANLHCHTTLSDGRATPATVKEEYKKRGYSIVAFTDHEHLINSKHLSDPDFLAITGVELSIAGPKVDTCSPLPSAKQIHINLYAKDPDCDVTPFYSAKGDWYKFEDVRHLVKPIEIIERVHSPECLNALIKRAHELGFLVSFNHPNWSLETAEDYLSYDGFDFIEVHNTGTKVLGYHNDEAAFNDMMKAGKRIFCVATDDNHNYGGFDPSRSDSFGGWTMIRADELEYGKIMDALERGDFYATTGPEIHSITLDDSGEESLIRVSSSKVKRMFLLTQGRRTSRALPSVDEEFMTEGAFKLYPQDCKFRIKVEDEYGRTAYSQIYDIPADCPRVVIKK